MQKNITTVNNTIMCNKVTRDNFSSKLPGSSLTAIGYWEWADYQHFFFLSCRLLLLILRLIAHAEKFRLIVCCAPREQLLSQGHIPSIPDSSKPFIPPPISCCASICICAGKHKYKGVENDPQSVITSLKLN